MRGHGWREQDRAAIVGDTLLGTSWVLFIWSVLLGVLLRLALTVAGGESRPFRAPLPLDSHSVCLRQGGP